jgi:hypothetical protein
MITLILLLSLSTGGRADEEGELVASMGRLQYFAHKTGLSIHTKNAPLARFYVHEIAEILAKLRAVKEFDGYAIGILAQRIIVPAFTKLEQSVESAQWTQAQTDYDAMLRACNQCHQTTARGYIKVEKRLDNPFMQSFAP